jgi:hypothetical protein
MELAEAVEVNLVEPREADTLAPGIHEEVPIRADMQVHGSEGLVEDPIKAGLGEAQPEIPIGVVMNVEPVGTKTDPKAVGPGKGNVAAPEGIEDDSFPTFDGEAVGGVLLAVEEGTNTRAGTLSHQHRHPTHDHQTGALGVAAHVTTHQPGSGQDVVVEQENDVGSSPSNPGIQSAEMATVGNRKGDQTRIRTFEVGQRGDGSRIVAVDDHDQLTGIRVG